MCKHFKYDVVQYVNNTLYKFCRHIPVKKRVIFGEAMTALVNKNV